MTLTDALHAALTEPADLEPLRSLEGPRDAISANPIHSLVASLFRFWLCDYNDARLDRMKDPVLDSCMLLKRMGASDSDLWSVHTAPDRSPEWVVAAERLTAWADTQAATP